MLNTNRVCQHLRMNGLSSKESSRFASLIHKWHESSGPEWTVSRLKDLEQFAKDRFNLADNSIPPIPIGWATTSTRRYNKRFADDLLHELFSSHEFDLESALHFTRISSAIILEKKVYRKNGSFYFKGLPPTKKQLHKTLTAIEGESTRSSLGLEVLDVEIYSKEIFSKYPDYTKVSIVPLIYSSLSETSSPVFGKDGVALRNVKRNSNSLAYSLEILYTDIEFCDFLVKNHDYVSTCIVGESNFQIPHPSTGNLLFRRPAGTINFIQEPGCKLRTATSPFLAVQAINEPLKLVLSEIQKSLPTIVTFDQWSGISTLKKWIDQEDMVWSLDASSFTDRFPLDFQVAVLKGLYSENKITKPMLDAFLVTTNHEYYSPELKRNIKYVEGQPQGLGPSFGLATVAHDVLLRIQCYSLGLKPELNFRVLGDDVIIKHKDLASKYMYWMKRAGVDINMTKSVISPHLGEFAGANVTQESVIMRPKLKAITNGDTVVSLWDQVSHRIRLDHFLLSLEKDHSKYAAKMHIPEDLGGHRASMSLYDYISLTPLNDFAVVKARLMKDIKYILDYEPSELSKYLEGIEWIKTGIIHGSHSYIDNPAREFKETTDIVSFPFSYVPKNIKLPLLKESDLTYSIDRVQALKVSVQHARSMTDLKWLVLMEYQDLLTKDGYFKIDKLPLNDVRLTLNGLAQAPIEDNPHVADRKIKVDTSWHRYLKR